MNTINIPRGRARNGEILSIRQARRDSMKRKTRKMIAVGLIFGAAASSAFAAEPKGGIPDETMGVVLSQEEALQRSDI